MLLAVLGISAFDEDPTRAGTKTIEALEGVAIRKVRTRRSELLGGDLMKSGLQGPVHQQHHQKDCLITNDSQKS